MFLLVGAALAGDWSLTPMPIGDYSTDHGIGYGGYGLAVRREHEGADDYQLRLGLQLFWSTGRYRNHWLKAEAPGIRGSPWSVEVEAGWEAWEFAPYYGAGNAVEVSKDASENFDAYDIAGGYVLSNLRRDLVGSWDAFATALYRPTQVNPYPQTRLSAEAPLGLFGGRATRLGVGLIHDTRRGLPNPTSGHATELSVRISHRWLGSEFSGFGLTFADRRFHPIAQCDRLVFASQIVADVRFGEEPFFMAHILGGSRWLALGGPDLLRGFPEGRFRGDGALVVAEELRWTAHVLNIRGHSLGLAPTPFFEVGRVWLRGEDDPWWHVHGDAGLGLRFIWDEDLVIRWDTAIGLEEYDELSPVLGMWFMFDHPF